MLLHPCFQGRLSSQLSCFPWESLWWMTGSFIIHLLNKYLLSNEYVPGDHLKPQASMEQAKAHHHGLILWLGPHCSCPSGCWFISWTYPRKWSPDSHKVFSSFGLQGFIYSQPPCFILQETVFSSWGDTLSRDVPWASASSTYYRTSVWLFPPQPKIIL